MTHALLYDETGQAVATFRRNIGLFRRSLMEVEQDADEILDSVRQVIAEAVDYARQHSFTIEQAGLATQRSSVVAWNCKTGQALSSVLRGCEKKTSSISCCLGKENQETERIIMILRNFAMNSIDYSRSV